MIKMKFKIGEAEVEVKLGYIKDRENQPPLDPSVRVHNYNIDLAPARKILGAAMFGLGSAAVLAAISHVTGADATVSQMVSCGVVGSVFKYMTSSPEEVQTSRPKRKM